MTNTYRIINHTTGETLQFDLAHGESPQIKAIEYINHYCWEGHDLTIKEGAVT